MAMAPVGGLGYQRRTPFEETTMPVQVPATHRDLLEKGACGHLATIAADGRPQVTPVWFDFVGGYIRVNSARGRAKDRNMRRDARVALSILDPDNAYRHLEIGGRVVEITEEGAKAHIDSLAKTYMGLDVYPFHHSDEQRVIYKIEPLRYSTMG
jgi:PPOX class probable F420-dependent enzyme